MPTYKFEALDTAGAEVKDAVEASNEEEASQKIKAMGYFVTKLTAVQGKGGKTWRLGLADRRIARIARSCQDLPGQQLFQYIDEAGEIRGITSSDVNDYLREISGADITAKDFRTWAGTVLAAMALKEFERFGSKVAGKRNIRAAIEKVAARLGNTATICRKCYVHPGLLETYASGRLLRALKRKTPLRADRARAAEACLLRFCARAGA